MLPFALLTPTAAHSRKNLALKMCIARGKVLENTGNRNKRLARVTGGGRAKLSGWLWEVAAQCWRMRCRGKGVQEGTSEQANEQISRSRGPAVICGKCWRWALSRRRLRPAWASAR